MKASLRKKLAVLSIAALLAFGGLSYKSDYLEIAKQLEIFTTLFKELHMNYVDQTNPADLMDSAIEGMLSELDPYTEYWNQQDVETSNITNTGHYTGIGATVDILSDRIIIVEPYKGYPADKAGLKAADEIIAIGGVRLEDFNKNPGELLYGAPKSKVKLVFERQGTQHTTVLTREAVEIKAVPYYALLQDNIGYLVLSQFNQNITQETMDALEDLEEQGADKIILDLRNNPGGLLSEAISVANLFLQEGELVTTTKSTVEKYNQSYYTTRKPVNTEIPLVVLINGRSASASEIVAGAFQDLDRAVVIGARSFGKGLVQRPRDLVYGTQLKVTISRYYTPSGRGIHAADYHIEDEKTFPIAQEDNNEFQTRNGRSVYGGGGIMPDIEMASSEFSDITNAMIHQNVIFDYATTYYYKHELEELQDFEFTEADYTAFKKFLKDRDFTYQTLTERHLEQSLFTAENEGFEVVIAEQYNQMLSDIQQAKKHNLDVKKEEIIAVLSDEIIKRYFYEEGFYDYHVKHSPEIKKALEILEDDSITKDLLGF